MNDPPAPKASLEDYRLGLRMARPPDPQALAREKAFLSSLESKGPGARIAGYWRLVGPGYLQSAMTLGGGTAASSLFAGAMFGYKLLWVAPASMLLGVIMLAAISHQTLSTGQSPFGAMKRHAGVFLAYGWAIGALLSSIIWHFPQYSLGAAVLVDLGDVLGFPDLSPTVMGLAILAWALGLSYLYGTSPALVRWYERVLKYMVWSIVLCFGLVVVRTGIHDWGALARGFFAFEVPEERHGVAGLTLVISGLAASVGVNMVFLFPYTQLARGWGREHRSLARFDLFTGMLLPYTLATSLMIIAMANTIHLEGFAGRDLKPVEAAQALAGLVGDTYGRVIFNLGTLGMALSTITLHMLCAGFVCSEWFGWKVGTWRYRLATWLPVPGVLGPALWGDIALWLAVPTSILCGFFLPLAYVGFLRLQRCRAYLGDDMPEGAKGRLWFLGMLAATLIVVTFLAWYTVTKGPGFLEELELG